MKILIIDNYDSFTYNLYQYVGEILTSKFRRVGFEALVKRNDEMTPEEVQKFNADRIIISPGPGTPSDEAYFGVCREVILKVGTHTPLLGVCLGMQGIADCFGGKVVRAPLPMHGKTSVIAHDDQGVYKNMPQGLEVMRYHSLMVEAESIPKNLSITSVISDQLMTPSTEELHSMAISGKEIMGIRHNEYPIEGIQYHPESFATEGGKELLANFLFQE